MRAVFTRRIGPAQQGLVQFRSVAGQDRQPHRAWRDLLFDDNSGGVADEAKRTRCPGSSREEVGQFLLGRSCTIRAKSRIF